MKRVLIFFIVFLSSFVMADELLTVNFNDISLKTALQIIAKDSNKNFVLDESLDDYFITLSVENTKYDDLMDIITDNYNLVVKEKDKTVFITTAGVISKQFNDYSEMQESIRSSENTVKKLVKLNYAKASDVLGVLSSIYLKKSNNIRISADNRTNSILINALNSDFLDIKNTISTLDIKLKKVMIDVRVVSVSSNFVRDLGVDFSASKNVLDKTADFFKFGFDSTSTLFSIGSVMDSLNLDLEINALELSGQGKNIYSPRLLLNDNVQGLIKQSTQIPIKSKDKNGNSVTTFKEIPLYLKIKPLIGLNNDINLDIEINKSVLGSFSDERVSINTNSINTDVTVKNNQSIVIGGVFESLNFISDKKVPFLGDLSIFGNLFKKNSENSNYRDLIIFITPKIVQ